MDEKSFGVFHRLLYTKLKEKHRHKEILSWKEITVYLNRHTVPKDCCNNFIKEMEQLKLLKKINKHKIRLL